MRRGAGWLVIGALFFCACRTPTQITVEVTTDFSCAEAKDTTITVGNVDTLEGTKPITVTASCTNGRVGSLVVVPSGGRTDEVAIRVVTGVNRLAEQCVAPDYQGCIVARRALHFLAHDELTLPVVMRRSCLDVKCNDARKTCVAGTCVSSTIVDSHACEGSGCDETVLAPTADAGPIADAGDAGSDADATVDAGDASDASDGGDAGPTDPLLAGALAGSIWPMRHGSPTHAARTVFSAPTTSGRKWGLTPPKAPSAIPVVGPDGVVYYADNRGYVARDPVKGELWFVSMPSVPTTDPALASDGFLYACVGTLLRRIDVVLGKSVDSATVGGCGDVAIGPGPTAYVAGDGYISAVDLAGMKPRWSRALPGVASGITLAPNGKLYVGTTDRVVELEPTDGTSLRPFPVVDGPIGADPIAGDDGAIYVATATPGSTVYAFDLGTTLERWHQTVDSRVYFALARGPDGTIYAGAGVVYAFEPTLGKLKWKSPNSGASYVSGTLLVDRSNVVIAGTEGDGLLVALDGNKLGAQLWKYPLGGSSPIGVVPGGDGLLYLRTDAFLDAIGP